MVVFIYRSANRNDLPLQDSNLLMPPNMGHLNALLTPGADGTGVSIQTNSISLS